MLLSKITAIASSVVLVGSSLVTGATSEIKTLINESAPALIRSAFAPGSFEVTSSQSVCVGTLPQVTLSWSTSSGATIYLIERQYPNGGVWEDVGDSSTLSFTDATYEAGYDRAPFGYRVQAQGRTGTTYSPTVKVGIPECATAVAPAATTTSVTITTAPAVTTAKVATTLTTTTTKKKLTKPVTTSPIPMPVSTPATSTTPTTSTQTPTPSTPTAPTPAPTPTTPAPAPTAPTTPTPASTAMKWGAYVDGDAAGLSAFETLVGQPVDIQAVFVGWGHTDDFPSYLTAPLKANGKTLLIFWEPSNGDSSIVNQPSYNYDSITNGSWDSSIKKMAADVKAYGAPVIIVPFEEMNGDWYPWSGTKNGNTPAKAIAAWRHVHDLFADVPNVKWGWAPNSTSWPATSANDLTAYYPGDAYVDYVGTDGFNFNDADGWQSFGTIFNPALTKLEAYKKPIYLFSMASAQGPAKAAWITDAFLVQLPKHPSVAGWIWFNTNKEKDWRVNSDTTALTAFKAIIP